jgi:hypothetical protein
VSIPALNKFHPVRPARISLEITGIHSERLSLQFKANYPSDIFICKKLPLYIKSQQPIDPNI